jgi:hypothetical protein
MSLFDGDGVINSLSCARFWMGLARLPILFEAPDVAVNDLSTHLRKAE